MEIFKVRHSKYFQDELDEDYDNDDDYIDAIHEELDLDFESVLNHPEEEISKANNK